ncbi:MAG: hypothetical protein HONBIEJF_00338 [Fimbriimonadaceae bacterium]|nr:hypothetical protein [Fimbriimonadaceae bacterium]
MISTHSSFHRLGATFACLGLISGFIPPLPAAKAQTPSKSIGEVVATAWQMPETRLLTDDELISLKGKTGENPYVAAPQKWSVVYKGVDLATGNFSFSVTDLACETSFGVPVNVSRTYSANNGDEGPFGVGWTLSSDIRSTAGATLKSSSAPVRTVPVAFAERPVGAIDPNLGESAAQPVDAVLAIDAAGQVETIQRDVDGILTNPDWDNNKTDVAYDYVADGSGVRQVMSAMTLTTPEGTQYRYETMGTEWGENVEGNVLKVVWIKDRHNNQTTFTYSTETVNFSKTHSATTERKLIEIEAPNGKVIEFVWGGNGQPSDRVSRVIDGGGRYVDFDYTTSGHLESATTSSGKVTTYGYDTYTRLTGGLTATVITDITDPRGLTTTIDYEWEDYDLRPWYAPITSLCAYRISHSDGTKTSFSTFGTTNADFTSGADTYGTTFTDWYLDGTNPVSTNEGMMYVSPEYSQNGNWQHEDFFVVGMMDDSTPTQAECLPDADLPMEWWINNYQAGIWQKLVRTNSLCVYSERFSQAQRIVGSLYEERQFPTENYNAIRGETWTDYNYLGSPLNRSQYADGLPTLTTEYAYHGADKYYQQKAVKDPSGRFKFSEYYTNTQTTGGAAAGALKAVYDSKYASYSNSSGSNWRNTITVTDANASVSKMEYDDKGRPVQIEKLHSGTAGTSSTYVYVKTTTAYDTSLASPYWGGVTEVVEDAGSGKINRTTETSAYNYWGKPLAITDAAGRVIETTYNADDQVTLVQHTNVNPVKNIASYAYGSSGITNGVMTQAWDRLSNVILNYAYYTNSSEPHRYGKLLSIQEQHLASSASNHTTTYDYTVVGDVASKSHATNNGTTKWGYFDFIRVGSPESGSRAFQTLNRLDSSGERTAEEFHYQFDHGGRLLYSAFAQSPNGTSDYDELIASRRAVVANTYNQRGQALDVAHWWQNFDSGGELDSESRIGRTVYTYDNTKGLRLSATYRNASDTAYSTEEYDYDSLEDYLTAVEYDGATTHTWSYDAAGNRANSGYAYDNLNRMSASPGYDYQHDILGNRTWRNYGTSGVQRYSWDLLNRMLSCVGASTGATYAYRADGMRVKKVEGLTIAWQYDEITASGHYDDITSVDMPTTRYMYDGSSCYEDDVSVTGQARVVTRYALGARGQDAIYQKVGTADETASYPLYDGHGNMVATLARSTSTPYYSVSNNRLYDVWGSVRSGSSTGNPGQRYCANLGHRQDDESGLIYMRARYYEPGTGRFVSEDPAGDGKNWYVYCGNNATNAVDRTGLFMDLILTQFLDDLLETNNAAACKAAENWAKDKILDMMAKKFGQIVGKMVGAEFELVNWQFDANGYLWLGDKNNSRMGIDFGDYGVGKHGTPHIDLYDKYASQAQKLYGKTRFALFIEGFKESMID